MGPEAEVVLRPSKPKRTYLKILHEDLLASEGWKKLSPLQQGEHLRMLLLHAIEGKIPERWARTASLRIPGKPPPNKKTRKPPNRYEAFTASWEKVWQDVRGEKYVWDGKQRGGIRTAFEKAGGDLLLFESRVRLMLWHKNPWHVERASPQHVACYWNELAGAKGTAKVQPPPVLVALPKVVCAYCGHYSEAEGRCAHCQRNWKPAAAMGR